MNKEFVPYKEALALKELGFDEECFAVYNGNNIVYSDHHNEVSLNPNDYSNIFGEIILAPLYQQAFRWFRERLNLNHYIAPTPNSLMLADITNTNKEVRYKWRVIGRDDGVSKSYQEAEANCLNELIKIVKDDNNY